MITREEMQSILKKKERQAVTKVKKEAEKTIDRCSQALRNGRLSLTTAPTSLEVFNIVKNAFRKEGIDVKIELAEASSGRSKSKKTYTYKHANYRFSLIEE